MFRLTALVGLFGFLAVLGTGCVQSNRVAELEGVRINHSGRALDPQLWERVDAIREETPQRSIAEGSTAQWLLPGFVQIKSFAVSRDGDNARTVRFSWNDLSSPLFLTILPLRISYSEYHFDREEERPVASRRLIWNPFWATVKQRGEFYSNINLDARGIPLLYATAKIESNEGQNSIRFNNALWTLGPALMKFDGTNQDGPGEGYLATPLLLGGVLGVVLWTDYRIQNNRARLVGHGPIGGLLGYWQIQERFLDAEAAGNRPPMDDRVVRSRGSRFVLGGIVWHDFQFRDEEERIIRSGQGPLWSAFGWGRKHDRFSPRVFFINL